MKVLMVTSYAPARDGIANYALQEVRQLRAAGHDVEVLSPGPSAAHHHLDLRGPRGALALAKRVRAYDRVVVQFHPDVFYPQPLSPGVRRATTAGLLAVARAAREIEVRVHEIDYSIAGPLDRLLWASVDRVVVHTAPERERFAAAFGRPRERVELAAHGGNFVKRTNLSQAQARQRFGLPPDAYVFLSIGFIQPHKGFDRAVRAFRRLGPAAVQAGARVEVVGSVRVEEGHYLDHLEELRALVASTPGAALHDAYVGDEAFDAWLVASDCVVLPYRHIWSSSVLERAALYDRPVIASRVGGLADQAPPGTVLVDDDDQLAAALRDRLVAAGRLGSSVAPGGGSEPGEPWPEAGGPDLARQVQAEVRRRAASERGPATLGVAIEAVPAGTAAGGRLSAPLRRIPPLGPPPAVSARPGASAAKRLVRRATGWQVDPVAAQVNRLQQALVTALDALDGRGDREDPDPAAPPR